MKVVAAFAALPAMGWAFPGLASLANHPRMAEIMNQRREAEAQNDNIVDVLETLAGQEGLGVIGNVKEKREPQLLTGLLGTVGSLLSDVQALTEALATTVDPDNLRPEPGYEFIAPGPTDSRGPCPGLNLLANYGYLPRNGNVTLSQVVEATNRGFNMGADLSTVLSVFAVLTDGDIASESWWLGATPDKAGGLNRHSTVECDISPNREDYYLGCGDNHHLSSRLFAQNIACAANSSAKDFGIPTMICQYDQISAFSQKYNPYLYYFPFPSIVSLGAFVFYPNFFSNGTYGAGGVANYESISSIIGAKLNNETGHFEYVPERWPENWYRRSNAYGAVQTLVDGFITLYPNNPVPMPIAQLGTPNFNVTTILCDVVEGITSITPYQLAGVTESAEAAAAWAVSQLANVGLSHTILGCPTNSLSKLYTNATGGPLNPPPAVQSWEGNNVYNKVYFTDAPTTPQCAHSYSS